MTSEQITDPFIAVNKLNPKFSHQFIEPFVELVELDLMNGVQLNFSVRDKDKTKKVTPIIKLAQLNDAKAITEIIKETYEGTYPYKEMEDENEVKIKLKSGMLKFILFQDNSGDIIGIFGFELDFKEKKGYMRTLAVKKK